MNPEFRRVTDAVGLRQLLAHSNALHYGYAQMSGVDATYDSNRPVGERIVEASVNGQPLEETKRYTVASSAFLANGGDNYAMLKAGTLVRTSSGLLSLSLLDYFRAKGQVRVPPVGRQRDLAGGFRRDHDRGQVMICPAPRSDSRRRKLLVS